MAGRPVRRVAITVLLVAACALVLAIVGVAWPTRLAEESPAAPPLADTPALVPTGLPAGEDAAPVTEPPTEPPPRTATILLGGDLLWHNTVWHSAAEDHARTGAGDRFDFDPMFAMLRPYVESADLAVCHEEVPFAAPGGPLHSYPVFAAPHQIAAWIGTMGWDACTTASNHSMDAGVDGIVRTADLLDRAGVAHVGTFRSAAERRDPVVLTTGDGVRVAIVAATYGLNGYVLPAGQEWAVAQLGDADDLLAQAGRARRAGADVVVAHVHWGTEYDHLPDAAQLALAEQLTASPDIDLVVGEHAHVVQPITRVNGTWVVYGMGNMVAQSELERPAAYEGITVRAEVTERPDGSWRVSGLSYLPTQWNHYVPGQPIRIQRATGAHLASIRSAVDGLGGNAGLLEQ
ncbi:MULTISPECIES: CapA family protein [unclassified Nocardioides]|uniref:CapA family protein n=1 Tax=unclassified Nocardioides TaxID=2615069 RepID=UPI0000EB631B|nr:MULTISPECIES: CapA family protein [unclassified Nocardioides]ABL83138.1 putative enzyme of poly-gamma-glutamate biosynthesis (capsule formation) [Nocardioides sp. JS614]